MLAAIISGHGSVFGGSSTGNAAAAAWNSATARAMRGR